MKLSKGFIVKWQTFAFLRLNKKLILPFNVKKNCFFNVVGQYTFKHSNYGWGCKTFNSILGIYLIVFKSTNNYEIKAKQ